MESLRVEPDSADGATGVPTQEARLPQEQVNDGSRARVVEAEVGAVDELREILAS